MKLSNDTDFINSFPKNRYVLPDSYKRIYEKSYEENRKGKTKMSALSQNLESWLHKQVAKSSAEDKKTLEIGAGTLNQLQYEKSKYYDIVEPFEALYKNLPELYKIRHIYKDIMEVEIGGGYDRIISIASFEHILNLPEVVSISCKLLNKDGILCVSIPNEGRFLWKLGYTLTTGIEFKKNYNLDYSVLMRYEHVNTADEIQKILKYFFVNVKRKLFGINETFALYRYYECKYPNIKNADDYLKRCQKQ